jgi:hypothetical protein
MSDLNQYSLSQLLGSKMKPIKAPTFGHFGLLETVAETAKASFTPDKPRRNFTLHQEKLVVRAFEETREGLPPEGLLWNTNLRKRFLAACQKSGLDFLPEDLIRRLQAIRKNPKKYREVGIIITPTTREESFPSILAEYAPIVEFAVVRLRYRYGVSIDEVLIDSVLGNELEKAVRAYVPAVSAQQIRQAALTLRKTRFFPRTGHNAFRRLRTQRLEGLWSPTQTLGSLDLTALPDCAGIVEIRETSRDLYISRNENIHGMLGLLAGKHAIAMMTSSFWSPNFEKINARFIPASTLESGDLERWELKLLYERKPVFNWKAA